MSQKSESDISDMGGLAPKRQREFSSEDESLNLSKYRKLTTEQKIKQFKKEDTASDTSSYETEEEGNESYDDGDKKSLNNKFHPNSNKQQGNSHSSSEYNPEYENTPSTIEQEYHCMGTGSESDVDSFEVSRTEELNLLENIRKPIEKVQRLAFISATYRMSSHAMNTSQFSCNADVKVNSNFTANEVLNRTVKKRNLDLYHNDKTNDSVKTNSISNGCENSGSDNTMLVTPTKAECVNTQDLPDTQIMDSESIAELECMDIANVVQPRNIKSEKTLQNIVTENVDPECVETFSDNICSENEKMVSQNVSFECGQKAPENMDSGYEKAVPECVNNDMNSTKLKNVAKMEYVNTQDLPDTQIIDSESIAELEYMDTENVELENIKSEIASQITDSSYVDSQYVENLSKNINFDNRKAVSKNIESEKKIDYEKEKAVADNVENNETVLRNINVENTIEQLDIVNAEKASGLLINASSANEEQTKCIDVESSGIKNSKTDVKSKSGDNPACLLNKNYSIGEDPHVMCEVMIPDNTERANTEPNDSSNASGYTPEHLYQAHSISDVVDDVITDASRASSVSDLNLAQLVLSLKQDIQELSKKVDKQANVLEAVVNANEINLTPLFAQTFQEKYNLQLPFSKIEDFDKFNQDLAKNTRFCNEFITSLCSYIDNNVTLTKNILSMLRKYMSKELVTLYTACKATGSKMILKDTLFCKCLLQATKLTIRNGLLPLERERVFLKSLGLVVSGAKSWVTHDDERKKSGQS